MDSGAELVVVEVAGPLAPDEQTRLVELEEVVDRNVAAYVETGLALREIRDSRLYRETYDSFDLYCSERWGFRRIHAHYLIAEADVHQLVNTSLNQAQARELVPLLDEPEKLQEVWQEVSESEEKVTAKKIREKVREVKPPKPKPRPKGQMGTDKRVEEVMQATRVIVNHKVQPDAWKRLSGTRKKQVVKSMDDAIAALQALAAEARTHLSNVD